MEILKNIRSSKAKLVMLRIVPTKFCYALSRQSFKKTVFCVIIARLNIMRHSHYVSLAMITVNRLFQTIA